MHLTTWGAVTYISFSGQPSPYIMISFIHQMKFQQQASQARAHEPLINANLTASLLQKDTCKPSFKASLQKAKANTTAISCSSKIIVSFFKDSKLAQVSAESGNPNQP